MGSCIEWYAKQMKDAGLISSGRRLDKYSCKNCCRYAGACFLKVCLCTQKFKYMQTSP